MPLDNLWTYTGLIRIHFNRKEEAPLLASITPGKTNSNIRGWEMLAKEVVINHGVTLFSGSNLEGRPGLDPIWWLECLCTVELADNGIARVWPIDHR